jgi:hypothetical protein
MGALIVGGALVVGYKLAFGPLPLVVLRLILDRTDVPLPPLAVLLLVTLR